MSTVASFHSTGIGVPCLVDDNGQRPSVMVRYFRVKELESLRYSFVMFLHLWNVAVGLRGRGRSMVVGMSERFQWEVCRRWRRRGVDATTPVNKNIHTPTMRSKRLDNKSMSSFPFNTIVHHCLLPSSPCQALSTPGHSASIGHFSMSFKVAIRSKSACHDANLT